MRLLCALSSRVRMIDGRTFAAACRLWFFRMQNAKRKNERKTRVYAYLISAKYYTQSVARWLTRWSEKGTAHRLTDNRSKQQRAQLILRNSLCRCVHVSHRRRWREDDVETSKCGGECSRFVPHSQWKLLIHSIFHFARTCILFNSIAICLDLIHAVRKMKLSIPPLNGAYLQEKNEGEGKMLQVRCIDRKILTSLPLHATPLQCIY